MPLDEEFHRKKLKGTLDELRDSIARHFIKRLHERWGAFPDTYTKYNKWVKMSVAEAKSKPTPPTIQEIPPLVTSKPISNESHTAKPTPIVSNESSTVKPVKATPIVSNEFSTVKSTKHIPIVSNESSATKSVKPVSNESTVKSVKPVSNESSTVRSTKPASNESSATKSVKPTPNESRTAETKSKIVPLEEVAKQLETDERELELTTFPQNKTFLWNEETGFIAKQTGDEDAIIVRRFKDGKIRKLTSVDIKLLDRWGWPYQKY